MQASSSSCSQFSAAARMRAVEVFPVPRAPPNRSAGGTSRSRTIVRRIGRTWRCPTTSANRWAGTPARGRSYRLSSLVRLRVHGQGDRVGPALLITATQPSSQSTRPCCVTTLNGSAPSSSTSRSSSGTAGTGSGGVAQALLVVQVLPREQSRVRQPRSSFTLSREPGGAPLSPASSIAWSSPWPSSAYGPPWSGARLLLRRCWSVGVPHC